MTVLQKIKETLGFDIKKDEYAFGFDPQYGYLSQKKIPERWVKTTCGYCSVGCGMVVGVKGGEIVSVRGDEEHPVNEGSLCPKGLSEHLPLKSPNRAHTPLWRGEPISWDRAYEEMVGRVRRVQGQYGKESFAVLSTGQLLNGLINLVIKHGYVDQDFVDTHTTGFEALAEHASHYPIEVVAEHTGLSPESIWAAFQAIAKAENVLFAWTMGVNHSTQGTDTVSLINTLALITGNIGRTGAAPLSITGQCNAMGTREFGFASSLPGYRKFESQADREELAALWGLDAERLPKKRGLAYPDIIDAILAGRIKALWVIATNPLASFPDQERLRQALAGLDLLVVQDGFHPTPTTELADLVLPTAVWGEKSGSYTNSERRASRVRQAVSPPGEAKADFDIFMDLARVLGVSDELFPKWRGPADAFAEMRRISKGRLCDYSGMSYEKMDALGGIQWPCNDAHPEGVDSLYTDGRFPTEDGRARLLYTAPLPLPEPPDDEYPILLNTGRTVEHWHTRTKTRDVPMLEKLSPEPWVEIHPQTARRFRLGPRTRVSLVSRRGRVEGLLLRITETIHPDQVFVPFHFAEQCVNQLTLPAFCPKSREPNYKQCAVRIERVEKTTAK